MVCFIFLFWSSAIFCSIFTVIFVNAVEVFMQVTFDVQTVLIYAPPPVDFLLPWYIICTIWPHMDLLIRLFVILLHRLIFPCGYFSFCSLCIVSIFATVPIGYVLFTIHTFSGQMNVYIYIHMDITNGKEYNVCVCVFANVTFEICCMRYIRDI